MTGFLKKISIKFFYVWFAILASTFLLSSNPVFAQENEILAVSVVPDKAKASVSVKLKNRIKQAPFVFTLNNPDRAIVDFSKTSNATGQKEITVDSEWLRSIDVVQVTGSTRLVFNLKERFKNSMVTVDGDTAMIALTYISDENPDIKDSKKDAPKVEFTFEEHFKNFLPLARQGNAEMQNVIGEMYLYGNGVAKDPVMAFYWFSLAAKQGVAVSQIHLGYMYRDGNGVIKDYVQSVHWFRRAAESGDPDAQLCLAGMYFLGQGVKRDLKKTDYWTLKSANQGYLRAQKLLAKIYTPNSGLKSTILKPDKTKAAMWYEKAAGQGDQESQFTIGSLYYNGDGVTRNFEKAAYWYGQAAEKGYAAGQHFLGILYAQGYGVPLDYAKAELLWKKAADQGHETSIKQLALWNSTGEDSCSGLDGVKTNYWEGMLPLHKGLWKLEAEEDAEFLHRPEKEKLKCSKVLTHCVKVDSRLAAGKMWPDEYTALRIFDCIAETPKDTESSREFTQICGTPGLPVSTLHRKFKKISGDRYEMAEDEMTKSYIIGFEFLMMPTKSRKTVKLEFIGQCGSETQE
ncbi:AMIN domain-containing protein [Undibacterium sp. Ji83W]|uniref:AMIN domain-containing protein n=1 Tax=Undibacterium sp. Ji83W TaxID=3413043 RepID=UPI003BF32ECE